MTIRLIKRRTLLAAVAFVLAVPLAAQITKPALGRGESGRPFVTYYGPEEYEAAAQVFSIAQDKRGVLYFGHGGGLLEFDGATWRPVHTPGRVIVRALTSDPNGRIYLGTVGDFGYLAPDGNGQSHFVSMLESVPKEQRAFQDVLTAHWTPGGIYFVARQRMFRLTPDERGASAGGAAQRWKVESWTPQGRFTSAADVFGRVYVRDSVAGLVRVSADSLEPVPGGDQFVNQGISFMVPFSGSDPRQGQILLGSGRNGLYLMNDSGIVPFPTDADPMFKSLQASRAVVLSDGTLAVGLSDGGLAILSRDGKVLQYLDRTSGVLAAEGVLAVFRDRDGMVWLGLQNGICKVETPSPLTAHSEASGALGAVNDIVRHRGVIYLASIRGLYYLDGAAGAFRKINGIPTGPSASSWSLREFDDTVLAVVSAGVFQVDGNSARLIRPQAQAAATPFVVARSKQDPRRAFIGLDDGLASIRLDASGRWIDEGRIADTPTVRSIVEPVPGTLWLGLESQGVARLRFQGDSLQRPDVRLFTTADGLPSEGGVSAHFAAGRMVFASKGGVREFDDKTGRFVPSPLFDVVAYGGSPEEYSAVETARGDIWVNFGKESAILRRQSDGGYRVDKTPVQRIANLAITKIYPEADGVVWFGRMDGVIRYDPSVTKNYAADYPALIRRVTAAEKLFLYGGAEGVSVGLGKPLSYRDNALRFEFAATSFESTSANQYQSRLEGFDDDWSAWSHETRREYTNLPPGNFRFVVRARNLFQHESAQAEFTFTILPPWYRTPLAYVVYAFLFLACVYTADRVMRRRVIKRERERSQLREAELRAQAAEAQAQTAEAQAQALQAENQRKKNVELLSDVGKELTASLDFETIFHRLYESVNQLMDAAIFGVGIYHPESEEIEYRLAIERGMRYAPYKRDTRNKNQFPVWCIENRQPVFINDVETEYSRYIDTFQEAGNKLEDGSVAQRPSSLLYLPLTVKARVLGIITVQSFEKNAYTEYHLDLLENLAAYTSIALDNADAYRQLNSTLDDLQATLDRLKAAQEQLVVQEKLASLGALTAGIAHEIKNPLNFVNNFADLSVELVQELREELLKHKSAMGDEDYGNIESLLDDLTRNAKKINEHGKRADSIVRSMLQHSRGQRGERQATDINALLEEYVNLSYHGMRAQDSSFNVTIERDYSGSLGTIEVVPQDISRVFLNILNNACYAVSEKSRKLGTADGFKPTLRVCTVDLGDQIEVRIRDNGFGIPAEVREQIFNPFFTTKPTGQGTGLGLSISHDIVVLEHGGQLDVDTEAGEFTEFVVRLPKNWKRAA